ncbi:1-phosphofructokinase family hexose kinase [Glutamicibacter sp.]|uniref:1-phosphofructokinase family hexose kinase n=1 Tax=Glutamicibacter sp. TaxID=1931995 RepID=UPI003D6BD0E6
MIVTLTCNPALDKTIELAAALQPGAVQRAAASHVQAAGKGVNVSRAVHSAGQPTLAMLPGAGNDPLILALAADQLPHRALEINAPLRTNTTLTSPDGTTTKINEAGPELDSTTLEQLTELVHACCTGADWLVMAGSLPRGVPADFYAQLTASLRTQLGAKCPRIAVDTSGEPLRQLFAHEAIHVPDLIKPNAEELAELLGEDLGEAQLEADPELTARTSTKLLRRPGAAVLTTLGAHGAVLATAEGCWHGWPQPITPRSTVGAGDSSLAGYLLADAAGEAPALKLRQAIAYGTAAASLPGSSIPTQTDLRIDAVSVIELTPRQGSRP